MFTVVLGDGGPARFAVITRTSLGRQIRRVGSFLRETHVNQVNRVPGINLGKDLWYLWCHYITKIPYSFDAREINREYPLLGLVLILRSTLWLRRMFASTRVSEEAYWNRGITECD